MKERHVMRDLIKRGTIRRMSTDAGFDSLRGLLKSLSEPDEDTVSFLRSDDDISDDRDMWQCFLCACIYPCSDLNKAYEIKIASTPSPTEDRWLHLGYACQKCRMEITDGEKK